MNFIVDLSGSGRVLKGNRKVKVTLERPHGEVLFCTFGLLYVVPCISLALGTMKEQVSEICQVTNTQATNKHTNKPNKQNNT